MSFFGFPAGSRKGRWSVFIGPMFRRTPSLYILRRSHLVEGNMVQDQDLESVTREDTSSIPGPPMRVQLNTEYGVRFELTKLNEGDLPQEPSIDSHHIDGTDVTDFLQACVDCAWEMGIYPTQFADRNKEVEALRNHLEDMRQLAGVRKHTGALTGLQTARTPRPGDRL
jgi:hypothetical protein